MTAVLSKVPQLKLSSVNDFAGTFSRLSHRQTCDIIRSEISRDAMKLRSLLLPIMIISPLLAVFGRAESLKVGDAAPVVSGITDSGQTLNLGDVYKDHTYTVVFFYPKALTGGCTKQGCSLRDANTELAKQGVAIVGVSVDPVEKQKEFKEKNHFPFPLVADTDKKVIKAFGQPGLMVASRECYVIKGGKIVYKDSGVTEKQGENVLAFLATQKT